MATSSMYKTPYHDDYDDLERKYWKTLNFVPPIYGADVPDSITDPDVTTMNISKLDSTLKYLSTDTGDVFYGVNSPYLYFGMWKATFSWHVEDMDLYGINFLHHGAPKTWYCVPPKYGYLLEQATRELFPNVAKWCSNFMRHKTCLVAPYLLEELGVPFQKVVQEERNIIIVFPYAYHSGFNHGFNIAESTNFASERWIEYGKRHRPCDCSAKGVKIDMAIFVKRFQPELYDKWLEGTDIAPHPEDPPDRAKEVRLRAENPQAYAKMLAERIAEKEKDAEAYTADYTTKSGRVLKFNTNTMAFNGDEGLLEEDEADFDLWQKINFVDKDGQERKTMLDTYQHVEMLQIKTTVYRDDLAYFGGHTVHALRKMLGRPELVDVKELINRGDLIKISEKPLVRDIAELPSAYKPKLKTVEVTVAARVYKHVAKDVEATVDPDTLELIGEPSKDLAEFTNDLCIKDLIGMGVFQFLRDAEVKSTKEVLTGGFVKKESLVQKLRRIRRPLTEIYVYRHRESGARIRVAPKSKRLLGKVSDAARQLLGDRSSARQLIDDGVFLWVKTVQLKPKMEIKKEEPGLLLPTPPPPTREKYSVYVHKESNVSVTVQPETLKIPFRKSMDVEKLTSGRSVKEMIEAGELLLVGEKTVVCGENSLAAAATARKQPGETTTRSFALRGDDDEEEGGPTSLTVDVAKNDRRVVYRFATTGAAAPTARELFVQNSFADLVDKDKINESEVKVENSPELTALLGHNLRFIAYWIFDVKGADGGVAKAYKKNRAIVESDRNKFADIIGDKSVYALEKEGTLYNSREERELRYKASVLNAILAQKTADEQESVSVDLDEVTGTVVVVNKTTAMTYVIKEEVKKEVKVKEEEVKVEDDEDELDEDFSGQFDDELDEEEEEEKEEEAEEKEVKAEEDEEDIRDIAEAGEYDAVPAKLDPEQEEIDIDELRAFARERRDDVDIQLNMSDSEPEEEEREYGEDSLEESSDDYYVSSDDDPNYGSSYPSGRGKKQKLAGKGGKRQGRRPRDLQSAPHMLASLTGQIAALLQEMREEKKEEVANAKAENANGEDGPKPAESPETAAVEPKADARKRLDTEKLIADAKMSRHSLEVCLPIFVGLNIIEYDDDPKNPIWHDYTSEGISRALTDILQGNDIGSNKESDTWQLCVSMLKIFMELPTDKDISAVHMQEALQWVETYNERQRLIERIRTVATVLRGLHLIATRLGKTTSSDRGNRGWKYNGPNIFAEWQQGHWDRYAGQFGLRRSTVALKRAKVRPEDFPKPRFAVSGGSGCFSSVKWNIIQDGLKDVDLTKLNEEQARSYKNMRVICKCGTKVISSSGKPVAVGFKKRIRCKECVACKRSKCLKCTNCLNPRNKQACVEKVCLFPKIPKCPCFD